MTEYVKLKAPEMSYGEANLLQSQLSLINLLKQYQNYEELRKEEIFLKIELKKKIGEASEFLNNLSKVLPESKLLEEQKKKEEMKKEITEKVERVVQQATKKESEYPKKTEKKEPELSLDQELEAIRKKLERLQ